MIEHGGVVFADFTKLDLSVLEGQGTPLASWQDLCSFLHTGIAKKLVLPTLAKPAS